MASIAHRLRSVSRMAGARRAADLDRAFRTNPTAARSLLESGNPQKVAEAIAIVCDALGFESSDHAQRLLAWGSRLAAAAGLDETQRMNLALGTLCHDIGKLSVEDDVLMSPSVLDPADLDRIHMHPSLGHALLFGVPGLKAAAELVLCHHEYFDGSGYPDGRRGTEIPLIARVFVIVDTYESMLRNDRPFREGVAHDVAMDELRTLSGVRYDPALVTALRSLDMSEWRAVRDEIPEREAAACHRPIENIS